MKMSTFVVTLLGSLLLLLPDMGVHANLRALGSFVESASDKCSEEKSVPGSSPGEEIAKIIRGLEGDEFVTQENIDASDCPDGYRFKASNEKSYFIQAIRADDDNGDKKCVVHLPSVTDLVGNDPPEAQQWLRLTIYDVPEGTGIHGSSIVCLAPLGGGCYLLIKAATS